MIPFLFASLSIAALPKNMTLTSLDGKEIPNTFFENKATLFVNVASKCGYTGQYEGLQSLYEEFQTQGLEIVGVPCNQFGGQEPGSPQEIITFCSSKYNVTFPLLAKQDVNGKNRSPLYQALISDGPDIKWNFEKILVDSKGNVVGRYPSAVDPQDEKLKADIKKTLP
jgi:hydroperoxy fatty acid reductase